MKFLVFSCFLVGMVSAEPPVLTSYGAPVSTEYGAPSYSYGAPETTVVSTGYGAPAQAATVLSTGYGAPSSVVSTHYGAPSQSVVSTGYGAPLQRYAPAAIPAYTAVEPFDPHPRYQYGYQVHDALTGDQKSASESRDGDVVRGHYSLVEPDGTLRVVTYTADDVNGFNAVVERRGGHAVATPVYVQQPQYVAAPPPVRYATTSSSYGVPSTRYGSPISTNYGAPSPVVTGGYA